MTRKRGQFCSNKNPRFCKSQLVVHKETWSFLMADNFHAFINAVKFTNHVETNTRLTCLLQRLYLQLRNVRFVGPPYRNLTTATSSHASNPYELFPAEQFEMSVVPQEGRMEGRKEGWKEGWKEGRKEHAEPLWLTRMSRTKNTFLLLSVLVQGKVKVNLTDSVALRSKE